MNYKIDTTRLLNKTDQEIIYKCNHNILQLFKLILIMAAMMVFFIIGFIIGILM